MLASIAVTLCLGLILKYNSKKATIKRYAVAMRGWIDVWRPIDDAALSVGGEPTSSGTVATLLEIRKQVFNLRAPEACVDFHKNVIDFMDYRIKGYLSRSLSEPYEDTLALFNAALQKGAWVVNEADRIDVEYLEK